jgi:hypothetical protein
MGQHRRLHQRRDAAAIYALAARTYTDENGETHPWLTKGRFCAVRAPGDLSAAEREIMRAMWL